MMWTRLVALSLAFAHAIVVNGFSSGAGGCSGGGPAVGGAHLAAAAILKPSDLSVGKFDLLVDGKSLLNGAASERFEADKELTIDLRSQMHQFKGALLRVHSETSGFTFEPGENAAPAFACDLHENVEGITHTSARAKRSMDGILHVSDDIEQVKLEVTVVIAANEILSLYLYQEFTLQFAKASSSLATATGSPSSLTTRSPTLSPSMTMQRPPTDVPAVISESTPSIAADITVSPMSAPTTSKTIVPSQSPTKPGAVGSAEEPTIRTATDGPIVRHVVTNIQMDLPNVTYVSIDEILRWEALTKMWFEGYFDANGPIKLKSTTVVLRVNTPVQLEEGNGYALRLLYDQTLEYESDAAIALTPEELVLLPFQEAEWAEAYVQLLSGDPVFTPSLLVLADTIDTPIVLGPAQQRNISRKLTNGLVWMVVAICFVFGMYFGYRLLINNRGGLKIPDYAPDTFSFIGSETSRRFGDTASLRSFSPEADMQQGPDGATQYEVNAPSGKLLVIFKSEEDGVVIEMVSEASPLADLVGIGDRLIRIDEIDVREQSAAIIKQTLKSRRTNDVRKLFFLKKLSSDSDDGDNSI